MNHLSEKDVDAFWNNDLTQTEKIKFLEHIETCDYCATQIALFMPDNKVIHTMPYVRTEICKKVRKFTIRKIILLKTELLRYTMRVGLAMGCALFLLFSPNILGFGIITTFHNYKITNLGSSFWDAAIKINNKVYETLYQYDFESEVVNYEKTEK